MIKPKHREVNSLLQSCTASRDQIPTQGSLTPKPGFLTIAPSRALLHRTYTVMLLEAPQTTPQTGISAGDLYLSSHIILPVDVEYVLCRPLFSEGETKAQRE